MEEIVDRRILRTKQMLREALMELIEQNGYEGISVTQLTEKAGLNRGTFYLHYRDLQDLLDKCSDYMLEGWLSIMRDFNPLEAQNSKYLNVPNPQIVKIYEYFKQNSWFFKVILGPKGDPAFPLRMKRAMHDHLEGNRVKFELDDNDFLVPSDYINEYVLSVNMGILQHWFETNMTKTPEEVAIISTRLAQLGPLGSSGMKKLRRANKP
ncbi:TetR/AcrR family transcriptional regulator [Paenibacillus zeisoli]|uniref:TetR/AcrR family transcriptional regulator n=1 Tax=Paenibacillus zeisoli TaxID=2496267 RepID=A0A3S1B8P0_9BACL|nr:TetR/AcrR family transcriptional regulator [Paenibacillus zeisoli]RUT35473.1 TetR/AcrR family transcriptional regulator [Paenibacillus zeisoli]